jgi:hypothetical protein
MLRQKMVEIGWLEAAPQVGEIQPQKNCSYMPTQHVALPMGLGANYILYHVLGYY